MRMLRVFFSAFGEFQAPPIGLEYKLQRFWSFSVDLYGRNYSWDAGEKEKIVFIRVDGPWVYTVM